MLLSRYVSNGNKLVRDSKKLIRILASEKVRWSLHTVRLRLAKKQQYCQFFTRFGHCSKVGEKCPYIHDPAKVAICTRFLRGMCSNTNCKLTHQVRYAFIIVPIAKEIRRGLLLDCCVPVSLFFLDILTSLQDS